MNEKKRFPTALLIFTLVLALLVTGLGAPGFALPWLREAIGARDKTEGTEETGSARRSGKTEEAGETEEAERSGEEGSAPVLLAAGKSKAFSLEPVEGVTISAEKNALDRDREFTFEPVTEEAYDHLGEAYWEAVESPGLVLNAWELDAGLADDEMLPGTFSVSFDLETLGVNEEDYEALRFYRVDDAGRWYEYAARLDGSTASFESSQNSFIVAVIGWTLIASSPKLLSMWQAYTGGAYLDPFTGCFDVRVPDKTGDVVMEIMLDRNSFADVLISGNNARYGEMDAQARSEALQRVIKENDLLKDTTMKDISEMPFIKKDFTRYYKEILEKKLQEDPDYRRVEANLNQYKEEPAALREEIEQVSKVKECAQTAWTYLKGLGVRMPTYKLRIELSGESKNAYGVTIAPYWGNPYMVIFMEEIATGSARAYEGLLLTMCHEMFHVVQRCYVMDSRANYKFDEMSAMALEWDAYDHFAEEGAVGTPAAEILSNLTDSFYFALPLNDFSTTYPEGTLNTGDKPGASYPIAPFLRYLRLENGVTSVSYPTILERYKGLWGKRSVTTILKEAFSLTDESLTEAYFNYAAYDQTRFYKAARAEKANDLFAPVADVTLMKKEVELLNKNYTIRVRRVQVKPSDADKREYALVLRYGDTYAEVMTDFKLLPLDMEINGDYREWEKGLFFEPRAYAGPDKQFGAYLMEVDGGTGTASEGYIWNDYGSYTIYLLETPDQPEFEVKDGVLTVKLQDFAEAPRGDVVDSYAVILRLGKTEVLREEVRRDQWKEPWTCKLEDLKLDGKKLTDAQKQELELVIRECVTGTFETGDPCLGPESEPQKLGGIDITGRWDLNSTLEGFDMEMLKPYISAMPEELRTQYEAIFAGMTGQQGHGIMIVEHVAEDVYAVTFTYDVDPQATTHYSGIFDEEKLTLALMPEDAVLTDPFDLQITAEGSELTFESKLDYDSPIVAYKSVLTGRKLPSE